MSNLTEKSFIRQLITGRNDVMTGKNTSGIYDSSLSSNATPQSEVRTFRNVTYTIQTSTSNNQTLLGTPRPDWFETFGVNHNINTGAGNDVVLTDVDFDSIDNYEPYGGEAVFYIDRSVFGNDVVDVGAGDDYVVTGEGNNIVILGQGNDIFDAAYFGGNSNDIVNGGSGNDIIDATNGGGNKILDGGSGNDRISANGDNVIINGGSGNDRIVGFGITTTIDSGNGNDFIFGGGNIKAGSGKDDLITFGQADGGTGNDFIFLFSEPTSRAEGGQGADTIVTTWFEPSQGGVISGGGGNDRLISGISGDTIYDGQGNDIINLRGGLVNVPESFIDFFGDSVLEVEGGGNDIVYAGQGRDTFILGLGEGVSTIIGYNARERVDLTGLGLSSSDISLIQDGGDTLLNVGTDSVAIFKDTLVNSVNFFV